MLLFLAPQAFGGVHRRAFVHLGGEAVAGEGGERRLMQVFAHLDEVHFPVDAAVPAVVSGVDPDAAAEGAQQFPAVVPGLAGDALGRQRRPDAFPGRPVVLAEDRRPFCEQAGEKSPEHRRPPHPRGGCRE